MGACLRIIPWLLLCSPAWAQPTPVILMGGGWGPEGTQASIEAQVLALQANLPHQTKVHFAGGSTERPWVQQVSATADEPAFFLGLVFDRPENLGVSYRPTQVADASSASVQPFLQSLRRARAQSHTIVFAAGHGAPASDEAPAAMELWGPQDRLTVPDLAQALDKQGGPSRTAFVLGHCHSGAFADIMFIGAKPTEPLATPTRCVLAAVPADREAAGCTPDINDPGAFAYMAAIADALQHRAEADFNNDGALSLNEADAWARIHDRTVDVPVRSSELWMDELLAERAPDITSWSRARVLQHSTPEERAVLTKSLARSAPQSPAQVAQRHADLSALNKALDEAVQQTLQRREASRRRLLDALLLTWPELANPFHVKARALLAGSAPQLTAFIKSRPELETLRGLDESIHALDGRLLAMQRALARLERWLRTAQRVANRVAINKDEDRAAQLARLEACEAMVIPPR